MGLVGYSDSEASSGEDEKPKQPAKAPAVAKSGIQKVVDSSNPRKIRVNLPEPVKGDTTREEDSEEPAAKKPRRTGGFSGFNSMLPAPKRQAAASTDGGPSRGLGRGVNLKTGATPGFSREPVDPSEAGGEDAPESSGQNNQNAARDIETPDNQQSHSQKEPVKIGNPMMFKPLSVARNPKKKKANTTATTAAPPIENSAKIESTAAAKTKSPKISLFSMKDSETHETLFQSTTEEYKPMLYHTEASDTTEQPQACATVTASQQNTLGAQSLDSIASDLNLSASAKRQLFGRGGKNTQAVNVMNFNTDEEWKANEELRATGEQMAHNPVRAIAPGKHTLKQLVNQVSNQRDALEDSFATGKANKKEAGNKYGW